MSNYEITKHRMAKEFLKYDQEAMIKKFSLSHDGDYLYLEFVSRLYRINRHTGLVEWEGQEADFNASMTIYDVLCCSASDCRLDGEFVNLKSLSSVQGSTTLVEAGSFNRAGSFFDGKEEALSRACRVLKGTPCGKGDVSCRIPLFSFFPLIFQFWSSDEEFPPTLELLLDKNALSFMHYETVWYAVSHLLDRLREEMEIRS